jgi:hypothetical protein
MRTFADYEAALELQPPHRHGPNRSLKDKHAFVLWILALTMMEPENFGLIFLAPQTWFCMN